MSVPVQSAGSGGKVLTAFIAGLTLGVIGMVEIAPSSLAGSAGTGSQPQAAVQDDGGTVPLEGPTDVASDGGTVADVEVGAAQPRTADPSGADGGGDGAQGSAGGGGAAGSVGGGGAGSAGASGGGGGGGGSGCAANNGGATDTGVSATEIKVAATTVTDGPGATLLAPATDGMRAVLDKVNANGGICGRRITLTTRNDTWDAQRGRDFLRKFIEDGNFSLLVVPSSEGLALAIETDLISDSKIPVVGSTGLRQDEYSDPWVFPVSTATVSIMRIMAQHAYDQGARTFGIAWDEFYKFGQEGRDAFVAQVKRLGGTVTTDVKLTPGQNYNGEANTFNSSCEQHGCDMVALLMVPSMGEGWKKANGGDGQGRGTQMTYGAQTLFTNDFATQCGGWCDGLVVWTGYNPPIGSLADRPDIRQYRTDVRNVNPSADIDNQFLQGAYLGSKVFVEAVTQCSPNVTRVCVRDTLNQMDYASDLSSTLSWRPDKRHANTAARAFRMQTSGGSFNGWQDPGFGFVEDPQL